MPAFIHALRFDDLPDDVVAQAKRCLLDLIGVAAAGSRTRGAQIACDHAHRYMAGTDGHTARMLFDGRRASIPGAAFAGGTTIDALDAHDGHALCKGHVGVAVLPALLAFVDSGIACSDRELLASVVVGYEIGTRAGIALHSTAADYHCSGAWNGLAAAAVGARLMQLDAARTREALGIAEYFGAGGQMMRVCDAPSMLKDGSGRGAHNGAMAALLARDGFTGAPAATVEAENTDATWRDLGSRWRIREQYFKAYPVCRWAQPAMEAVRALAARASFDPSDIAAITIESFREAVALGAGCAVPSNTEEAQYSITHPVAAMLAFGDVGPREIAVPRLADPLVRRLMERIELVEDAEFSRRFPAERWARVRIRLSDGTTIESEPAIARGNPENPLTGDAIREKYRTYALDVLGRERSAAIEDVVDRLGDGREAVTPLLEILLRAARAEGGSSRGRPELRPA